MKKGYVIAIVLILLSIIGYIVYVSLLNNEVIRNYHIKEFNIEANIKKNGDMSVVEDTIYRFNGKYNGITITIPTSVSKEHYEKMTSGSINDSIELPNSLYVSNGINDVKIYVVENGEKRCFKEVVDAALGDSGVYKVSNDEGMTTYTIFEPSKNMDKQIVIEYTLQDIAVKHKDVGELYWNFVGGNVECNIKKLNITVNVEGNIQNTYIHGNASGRLKTLIQSIAKVRYTNVRPGQFVATRVVTDIQSVVNAKKVTNFDAKELIEAQEQSYASKTEKRLALNVAAIGLSILYFIYWLFLIVKYEKEIDPVMLVMDEENILNKYNPMVAACIAQNREMHPRDIIAVIIDLSNVRALKMQHIKAMEGDKVVEKYVFEKDPDFFNEQDKVDSLDNIQRQVLDMFLPESTSKFELAEKLYRMQDEPETVDKLKKINETLVAKLEKVGANLVRVPTWLLVINNILFILTCAFILFVMGFNVSLNMATLSTSDSDLLYKAISNMQLLFIGIIMAIPVLMYVILFLLKLFNFVRKKIDKLAFKLSSKKITRTIISLLLIFILVLALEVFFLSESYILVTTILLFIAILIIITDNLMSSHATSVQKDYVQLKILEYKIKNGSLLEEKKIQDNILWNRYLALAVALGVGDVAKYANMVPEYTNLSTALEEYSSLTDGYYELYAMDSAMRYNNRISRFEDSIHTVLDKYKEVAEHMGSGGDGFSGGGSSFGGGGFSGGGGRRPVEEELFKDTALNIANICMYM